MTFRKWQKGLFSLENETCFVSIACMSSLKAQQDQWSGKIGVILAVAGSAVGLGNFLRFPGLAAQYGGGAFMVAYGMMLVLVGVPVAWAEWSIGRRGGQQGAHCAPGVFWYLTKGSGCGSSWACWRCWGRLPWLFIIWWWRRGALATSGKC